MDDTFLLDATWIPASWQVSGQQWFRECSQAAYAGGLLARASRGARLADRRPFRLRHITQQIANATGNADGKLARSCRASQRQCSTASGRLKMLQEACLLCGTTSFS